MNWLQTLPLFINTHRKGGIIPAGIISVADKEDLVHSGLEDTMIEAYANVHLVAKLKVSPTIHSSSNILSIIETHWYLTFLHSFRTAP
jgi:hypothetical protein